MYVAVTYLSVTCVHTKPAVLWTFNKVLVPTSEDDSQYFHFCFWNRVLLYYCRLALNCWPFCLGLLGSGIIGMHHLAKPSYTESYQNILLLASPGNWWPVVMKTGDPSLRFMTFVRISLLFLHIGWADWGKSLTLSNTKFEGWWHQFSFGAHHFLEQVIEPLCTLDSGWYLLHEGCWEDLMGQMSCCLQFSVQCLSHKKHSIDTSFSEC